MIIQHRLKGSTALVLFVIAAPVVAQTMTFNIPAQSAVSGIPTFARQANIEIVAPARELKGKETRALKGSYPIDAALALLLDGTGLNVGAKAGRTISLVDGGGALTPLSASPQTVTETGTAVSEIIVTANRRAEKSQSVAAALTVLSGSKLEERNINTVNDIENSVPSLEATSQLGSGQTQFSIRGIGLTDYAANNTGTVGVYVDEVNYPYAVTFQGSLFDINHIEVLRGPQGTLFGRNTTAGVVSITTNGPTQHLDAGLTAEFASFNAARVDAFVSGPLTETVSARLAVSSEQGGAWQINRDNGRRLGDKDKKEARLKLAWKPDSDTHIDVSAHYDRDRSDGLGLLLRTPFQAHNFAPLGTLYPADTNQRITGFGISPLFASLTGEPANAKPNVNNEGYGGSLRLRHDFGWAELTAIVAHEYFDRKEFEDFDATSSNEAGEYFFNRIDTQSEEIRLASAADKPFRYLAGFYRSDERNNGGFMSDFTDVASLREIFRTTYHQPVQSTGVFGDVDYDITHRLTVTLGGRYEYEVRSLNGFVSQIIYPTVIPLVSTTQQLKKGEFSGKAELVYHLSDEQLVYANVARGVKSGGFTTYNSGLPAQIAPFQPEKLLSYEAGTRSDFFDHRLRINASGFYYDYRDQQLQGVIFSQTQRIGKLINVPRSHLYGGEIEITVKPVPALQISQSVAYKAGAYDEFNFVNSAATIAARDPVTGFYNTIVTSNQAGQPLPNFPRFDFKGEASYVFAVSNWQITPEINYNRRSSVFLTTANIKLPAYWLANANLTVTPPGGHFTIGAFVNNLTDSHYYETANAFVTAATFTPHEVRTFGVRASVRY